jgi:hypothetical protein
MLYRLAARAALNHRLLDGVSRAIDKDLLPERLRPEG